MISTKLNDTNLHIGDTIRVHSAVVEGNKQRVQVFEGILISINGRGENKMITVRHIGAGVGVERKWPMNAKSLVKIDVKRKARSVRRAKLYYLRKLTGKAGIRV